MVNAVHLVRHGEVSNPDHVVYADLPEFGLSETGRAQAHATGEFLADRPIVGVFASPLTRAVQTAEAIADPHGLAVEVVDQVTEFGLSNRWRGCRWDQLKERFPGEIEAYLDHPWDLPFSPESLDQMMDRMERAITSLAGGYSAGELVVVSHQDPVQAARVRLTGRSIASFTGEKPGHAEVITLVPGTSWRETSRWSPPFVSRQFPPPRHGSDTG